MKLATKRLASRLSEVPLRRVTGKLVKAIGPLFEAELPGATVGSLVRVEPDTICEVVGFQDRRTLLMPLKNVHSVPFGAPVVHLADALTVPVTDALIGRVVDALGVPLDDAPLQATGRRRITSSPPDPMTRSLITEPFSTGIRAIDGLLTLGRGQRVAILAGSGVGKSTLLGMLARKADADVTVLCLVGERGREVREFIERDLGPEGLARSVVVVATADRPPAFQVKAAFTATAIAEYFRDQGKNVLLLVDSLTRMAMAQRQIGLASGEPPTTRGYTPSVFTMLPRLLERAGRGSKDGSITGIYNVLVEGDDIHDPIADAVRGIVDGHIVLSRKLATHGHFPAIDILNSVSRLMSSVADPVHNDAATTLRGIMATWAENEELIRLGAYRVGTSPDVDRAIALQPKIETLLRQKADESISPSETLALMAELLKDLSSLSA
jgi:flagellum-specific ATP synthase